jgi:cytidylate kinase
MGGAGRRFAGVVAVDGPSGTGKSTVARELARQLGARYLDTGAMYRAATAAVLRAQADPADADAVIQVVEAVRIDITTDPDDQRVSVDDTAVDAEIRGPAVTAAVSAVAAVPRVRELLVGRQRELIGAGGIVVEGRDIGTVVAPGAAVKVYLTASAAERARRRSAQDGHDVDAVAADIARRDAFDSARAVSPLQRADDAVVVDSTDLSVPDVVARIAAMADRVGAR